MAKNFLIFKENYHWSKKHNLNQMEDESFTYHYLSLDITIIS